MACGYVGTIFKKSSSCILRTIENPLVHTAREEGIGYSSVLFPAALLVLFPKGSVSEQSAFLKALK